MRNRVKKIISIAIIACFIFSTPAYSKPHRKKRAQYITAKSAVVVDLRSNKILYYRNHNMKLPPASTAKLITALVVIDKLKMNQMVRIGQNPVLVQPTKVYLSQGAYYRVQDLLHALLMESANDAGVALAEAVSGSEEEFAKLMNKKARQIGAKNSHFCNATGLPQERQYSTAYDLSLIVRRAVRNKSIKKIMMTRQAAIYGTDGKMIYLRNYNEFLCRMRYPVVLGKTGYTRNAQRCFAGVAYYMNRQVAVVVLRSTSRFEDIRRILRMAEINRARRRGWFRI